MQEDFNVAAERDLRVIVPVALLVITVILGILLQAIVAPLVLIATVVVSFFGTLGLSIFFFIEVQGSARRATRRCRRSPSSSSSRSGSTTRSS